MKIRIKTQAKCDEYLRKMAKEGGVSIEDLAEIAIYNLVACYLADRNESLVPYDAYMSNRRMDDDLANKIL